MIPIVTRRIIWSVAAAIPLASIALTVADSEMTPKVIRYLIAPGYVLAERLPSAGTSFPESISRFVWFALTTNAAYYFLLILLVLWWRASRHSSSSST